MMDICPPKPKNIIKLILTHFNLLRIKYRKLSNLICLGTHKLNISEKVLTKNWFENNLLKML